MRAEYINVCERPQPRVIHRRLKICTWAWSRECRCPRKSLHTVTRIHSDKQRTLCQLLKRPCPLCDKTDRQARVWTEVITTGVRFYRHGTSARDDKSRTHHIKFRWAPVIDPDPAAAPHAPLGQLVCLRTTIYSASMKCKLPGHVKCQRMRTWKLNREAPCAVQRALVAWQLKGRTVKAKPGQTLAESHMQLPKD